ncbi:MAG TPA: hypothetical protein VE820_12795 [Sphingomicrobium sp.]|nr:hypothetical protein [Sphingomicrobium sp.]
MTIAAVIVAVVLAFLAFKFLKGVIKLGLLVLIVVFLIWFFANGVAH